MDRQNLESATRKAFRYIIPFLFVCYIINFLDRANVGFAGLEMNEDLGLTATAFGFGAGIFFIGYILFEVPSNLILERVGAKWWIARIMVTWGLIAMAMSLIQGPTSFYVLRFLLGVAEAGFVPGVFLYLTYWFPSEHRAKAFALFLLGIPVSTVIGSPLSGAILQYFDGVLGWEGWRWLYFIEGAPAVLLGIATLFVLIDNPAHARWLTDDEKDQLARTLAAERAERERRHHYTLRQALTNARVLVLCLVWMFALFGFYGINFWLPQILGEFGGLSNLQIGFVNAIPYALGAVAMVVWSWNSDRTKERVWHIASAMFLGAAGLGASAFLVESPALAMVAITFGLVGVLGWFATTWTLPTAFLSGTAAAGGFALINSVGNLGSFLGPYVVSLLREATGSFSYALLFLAASLLIGGLIVVGIGRDASLREAREEEFEDLVEERPPAGSGA